jgi:hypothetical protein
MLRVNITPKGRKVREKALDYREQLIRRRSRLGTMETEVETSSVNLQSVRGASL